MDGDEDGDVELVGQVGLPKGDEIVVYKPADGKAPVRALI